MSLTGAPGAAPSLAPDTPGAPPGAGPATPGAPPGLGPPDRIIPPEQPGDSHHYSLLAEYQMRKLPVRADTEELPSGRGGKVSDT